MAQQLRNIEGNLEYNNLIADITFPVQSGIVKLKGGQGVLVAGSVIALDASNVGILSSATAGQTIHSVLTDDVDTGTSAETTINATVYLSGVLNRKELVVGGESNIAAQEDELRQRGIYLKDVL